MTGFPCLVRWVSIRRGAVSAWPSTGGAAAMLEFVAGRARPNTLRAVAFDLEDVLHRRGEGSGRCGGRLDAFGVSWLMSAATAAWCGWRTGSRGCRRGRSSAGCRRCRACMYLVLCGEVAVNPVPRGLATRRRGSRGGCRWCGSRARCRGSCRRRGRPVVAALRPPGPGDGQAMLLGGLRVARRWVCGSRTCAGDRRPGDRGGQGRPSAAGADVDPVLRLGRRLCRRTPAATTTAGVRRVEGPAARPAVVG